VIDKLARSLRVRWKKRTTSYEARLCRFQDSELLLVKPLAYMNRSGIPVAQVTHKFGASAEELLVVCDDASLELGRLRLRKKGSAGGHKGLQSIIDHLGTQNFARLRIGIGPSDPDEALEDYVLSAPVGQETKDFSKAVGLAAEAALVSVSEGIGAAMNRFN
jgi:PTH1 family peptidyl-tRNA hydrolase